MSISVNVGRSLPRVEFENILTSVAIFRPQRRNAVRKGFG